MTDITVWTLTTVTVDDHARVYGGTAVFLTEQEAWNEIRSLAIDYFDAAWNDDSDVHPHEVATWTQDNLRKWMDEQELDGQTIFFPQEHKLTVPAVLTEPNPDNIEEFLNG